MTITLTDGPGVDTLRPVTPPPVAGDPDDPDVFDVAALEGRYAMSRQAVHEMLEARRFPDPTRVGRARGTGSFAWSRAQVHEFESRPENADWVARRRAIAAQRLRDAEGPPAGE